MRVKSQQGVALAVVSLILFFAGTGLCLLNHWNKDLDFLTVENMKAVAMAAFLTTAEFSFLWCDFRLILAKKLAKKLALAACLVALICSMGWAISTEWEAAEKKVRSGLGMASVSSLTKQALESGKTRAERMAATKNGMEKVTEMTKELTKSSAKAYTVNFIVALLCMVVAHFCVERAARRSIGGGNLAESQPELIEKARQKIGFSPDAKVRIYNVPGGKAVHVNGEYRSFLKDKEL